MGSNAETRPTCAIALWLFLRAMGVIYLLAFASLGTQILGLVGSRGILPAQPWLTAVAQQVGPERYWLVPTLFWIRASDAWLLGVCVAGLALSTLLIADVAPTLVAALLWLGYLSFVSIGRDFLAFQWDNLLLEAGFLTILASPWRLRPGRPDPRAASPLVVWLLRWLLFRLMFSSGMVKLVSGDPTWRGLSALLAHYATQPLPTPLAWYAQQLPVWFHRVSCAAVFGVELIVPWMIFGPRPIRVAAGAILLGFQVLIALTGNYGFFNVLTMAFCLPLLDDGQWPARVRAWLAGSDAVKARSWPRAVVWPLAASIILISAVRVAGLFRLRGGWPRPVVAFVSAAEPLRVVNSYGLFAVMTTMRHEIVVEGSLDGTAWTPYVFRYKPGDPMTPPPVVAPHQPRLDWQMWFAALGSYRDNPWFLAFCQRLLEGSPSVPRLLAADPFHEHPPQYVRALVYDYHFTDWPTRRATGAWWRRELLGSYCPVLSLKRP